MSKPILWSSTFTSGTIAHLAAAEAEADLDIRFISLRKGEHKTPEFLAINPKGQVPALQFGPGRTVTESTAILSWIALTHPQAGLLPADPYDAAKSLEWSVWATLQFGSVFPAVFSPSRLTGDPSAEAAITARGRERALDAFAFVDAGLARGDVPQAAGGGVTLAEIHLFFFAKAVAFMKLDLAAWPALAAHHARIGARPRVAAALAREQEHG